MNTVVLWDMLEARSVFVELMSKGVANVIMKNELVRTC